MNIFALKSKIALYLCFSLMIWYVLENLFKWTINYSCRFEYQQFPRCYVDTGSSKLGSSKSVKYDLLSYFVLRKLFRNVQVQIIVFRVLFCSTLSTTNGKATVKVPSLVICRIEVIFKTLKNFSCKCYFASIFIFLHNW